MNIGVSTSPWGVVITPARAWPRRPTTRDPNPSVLVIRRLAPDRRYGSLGGASLQGRADPRRRSATGATPASRLRRRRNDTARGRPRDRRQAAAPVRRTPPPA